MKKLMVYMILTFVRVLTKNLNSERRGKVINRVRDNLDAELIVSTSNGRKISFHNNTEYTFRMIHDCQIHEPDTAAWIEDMPADGLLWDIGSNIGFFTLYAASFLAGDGIRVVAFEPAAANYSALNSNIEGNGLTDIMSSRSAWLWQGPRESAG